MGQSESDSNQPRLPDRSADRRAFFRRIVLGGLDKLERAGRKVTRVLDVAEKLAGQPVGLPPAPTPGRLLRPPGALPEPLFAQTCTACEGCTKCLEACPAQCIRIDPADPLGDPHAPGGASSPASRLPYVVARESPCVVCDDLSCMKVCPTGALTLVAPSQIRMGFAGVDFGRCLRGESGAGEDCQLCIASCPMGESAIGLDERNCIDVREGCVGCGVCERACPTEPASITVTPRH